ncbi:phosphate ABC transporter substrate-binding protein [Methanothermobacter wolfeii]|uniref:phosphate ABC transporter substrate-binding protein n=1 Tax=Methanothermobacter wolfeii TaxID=145261 RepID=UPI0024B33A01|nr:phosphate ABC transporter substrate-binding protein [Methanothermobacter wolfeii]MDI6703038.1 phosphate ABC transporter substrate-binding protein [Methanothermobacter wolfeii]MDI6842706.1 phosphate ABC transporter substrate-binding protein [Methanothermobacter wolfeii]
MDVKIRNLIIIIIIIALAYFMIKPGANYERIEIAGSTSVQPVAEKLAAEYMKKHPNVRINVQGGGSGMGIRTVQQGVVDIGTSSKALKPEEKDDLREYVIGKDGVIIAVNHKNPVDDLTEEQLRDIFSGKIRNWKEVGGPDAEIHVIVREEGSGTRSSFVSLVMKNTKIRSDAIVQGSTESVKQAVKSDPYAIGFVSMAHMSPDVKALEVNGVTPSETTVADGSYPLVVPFEFITKGEPEGAVKDFIDWVFSPEGQAIVRSQNVVPAIANVSDDT